ncbi:MAG: hypothetical protein HY514_01470 [Candidatus Aenigmarchaeota archaeon]|nr:hypothetical protein [Candidatus Aenigmarchaeota archaeon]
MSPREYTNSWNDLRNHPIRTAIWCGLAAFTVVTVGLLATRRKEDGYKTDDPMHPYPGVTERDLRAIIEIANISLH